MATYDVIFNVAKASWGYYGTLPGTNDAIVAIPLAASGIATAAAIIDYDTVAAVLAGATNEQLTMGRQTCTGVNITVDDAVDKKSITCDPILWPAASGANIAALLFAYVPDTTTPDDNTAIPLFCMDFVATPAGDLTYQPATTGLADAA